MFEKEAKEYTHTKHCEKCFAGHCEKKCFLVKDDFETFKAGAAFGYNKAIVEIKDAYEGNGNFSAWFENYLEGKNV